MVSNRRKSDRRLTTTFRTNNLYKAVLPDSTVLRANYKVGLISQLMVLGYMPDNTANTTFTSIYDTNNTTKIITYLGD